MATILTPDQQRTASAAARKAGGYDELIRLERERRAANGNGQVEWDRALNRAVFVQRGAPDRER
jgi:hypothetical protein